MEKEILVKFEGEEWQDALNQAFKKANKTAKIDGFRPGKAPKDVFLKKYGIGVLFEEAAEILLEDAYKKVMEDNKDLQIVAQPRVEINSVTEDAIEYKFVLVTKPEVELGKYNGFNIKKEEVTVTDEEVDEALINMRKRYTENVNKDGKVEDGDIAVIDFEGFDNGVPFEGGKGEDYSLKIGSNTFIPGFEEQIIGMSKGEEKDINVTFPEDYHSENLKGKPVVFKVKVKEVQEVKLPELDKDFFEDLGMEGIEDAESLKKQLKENIEARKTQEVENKYIDELLEAAAGETKVSIPHIMIHDELDRMLKQYEERLKMQGITLEMFYQFTNSDEKALKDQLHGEAEKNVKYRLMLEAIAEKENIQISDEEASKEAEDLAIKYDMNKDEFLKLFGGLEMVKYDLSMKRAIEILKK
ncbi:MAG: trigger factor [Candidatus Faecisoma sp.]|jgi:trigger factor|nr:trigger factor [Acholeplasma sp.]MCI5678196.1 trigger factor [Acholeplasma sp.]MDY2892446.1 trigger factor [Candidatus Faecisoma sp.]CCY28315.1 trigger factor [Acholeplasma sp. CAG:878]